MQRGGVGERRPHTTTQVSACSKDSLQLQLHIPLTPHMRTCKHLRLSVATWQPTGKLFPSSASRHATHTRTSVARARCSDAPAASRAAWWLLHDASSSFCT